uniref:Large ribosomal subunit protein uL22c n=1 Tax=Halymenia maculata TaxID=159591 RepID=A0A6G6YCZ9_9FLOR|nr:ribosomal protein L22 [Halymenia maculata]QIG87180.1 ribosomal protein L22 [Halymenia maculata]
MIQKDMKSKAIGKYLRLSKHKTRRILDQIRGKDYQEGLMLLEFMPYKPCKMIKKVLESAGNNANNINMDQDSLIISQAFANAGPKLKRFQPRAQGRAFPIHKPTCHITITLTNKLITKK